MQIFKDEYEIDFAKFSEDFPGEAQILKNSQHENWKFTIEGDFLKLLHGEYKPIFINVTQTLEDHKRYFQKHSYYQENLAKALGLKKGKTRGRFCDATAGMLGDSLMMSSFDIDNLDSYERHPLAAVLIYNALRQSAAPINFHFASASEINEQYAVIYYDPMYEDANVKSAPKKEMQMFRDLVGKDADSVAMARHLRTLATERLVIKRPIKSKPILEDFSHQIKGKSTRYDVYMNV